MQHLLWLVLVSVAISPAAAQAQTISGAWQLTRDDDSPGKTSPTETLFFYPDGRLLVAGTNESRGRFRTSANTLTMFLQHDGNELRLPRTFDFKDGNLRFKNTKVGFAWYRKVKRVLPSWDEWQGWRSRSIGHFKFRVPPGWIEKGEAPTANGHQRLAMGSSNGEKGLIIVRFVHNKAITNDALTGILKDIVPASLPPATFDISKKTEKRNAEFFGRKATVVLTIPSRTAGALQAIAMATSVGDKIALIAVAIFVSDELGQFPQIMGSLDAGR